MSIDPGKPLLILDLDETLIFATSKPLPSQCDFTVGPYHVYKRPFVDHFLSTVQPVFDLAIWSSASADYVATIVDSIVPTDIRLAFQWSRSRCTQRYQPELQESYWVKDLKKVQRLGYDLRRVLVVDDSSEKVERNYGNAIYVKPFEGDSTDQELRRLGTYLVGLANRTNFRTVEKRNWRAE
ncbi:MAG: HAD family hydrolase [Planctomycetota bacterium]